MTPSTPFFQLSGGGNDFLALVEPAAAPAPEEIRGWCRRGISLGADGLFVLRRRGAGRVEMGYWNSDGLPADLCLNGTRCAVQLAAFLGWDEDDEDHENGGVVIETAAGPIAGRRVDESRTALEVPIPETVKEVTVDGPAGPCRGFHVLAGVPHFVLPWPEAAGEIAAAPVEGWGRPLRHHPAFGDPGANVNFVRFTAPDRMAVRTYERGVEAETLCCGTGVIASTAAGLAAGESKLPLTTWTQGGFELTVERAGEGHWLLTGDARIVARGEILPGALP
jgi:diaminopimelate epimerase